ncbi:MAG: Acb2/Tad1 domain-containing protein [Candidatus Heimdallarchaeaceae archaeon]
MGDLTDLTAVETKEVRLAVEVMVQLLQGRARTREISLAITKLEEGKMWLGKHLGTLPEGEDLNAKRDAEEMASKL